ncbi:MAG: substrate-binding domain-containing protein [Acidimicrobiales bacterium]
MSRMFGTRKVLAAVGVSALAGSLALFGSPLLGSAQAAPGRAAKTGASAKVYTFVLSNNFLGNDWRPQMERLAQLTANLAPFKGVIKFRIVNSAATTQAQIADLNNIVATKPSAILIDAGDPTALNPTIARACAAGIKVVTFDNPATAPCAWKVQENMYQGQIAIGQWMAKILKGKGGVFVDRGLPGAPVSAEIENGFLKGLHTYGPSIKVLGYYTGGYAIGPEEAGVTSLLAGYPNVSGVHTQGYCTPIFKAFQEAGKPIVPTTCYGYNGEMVSCVQMKASCAILSGSPVVVQIAMKLALDAVEGKATPPTSQTQPVPMTLFFTGPHIALTNPGVTTASVVLGTNAFPNLPPGLALPFSLPQYKITPMEAAGK